MLCIAGLSASGKSTVAAQLAHATGRPVLSSDVVRKRLAGVPVAQHGPDTMYEPARNAAVYRALGAEAAAGAAAGVGVIVDATFRRGSDVAEFSAACGAPTRWLECCAPERVLMDRARRRDGAVDHGSDAGDTVVRRQIAEHPGRLPLPGPPLAVLDTASTPPYALLGRLAAQLDEALGF